VDFAAFSGSDRDELAEAEARILRTAAMYGYTVWLTAYPVVERTVVQPNDAESS